MPTPTVTFFGFSTAAGVIGNVIDGNEASFWQPYADGFDAYPQPIIAESGLPYTLGAHPAIQFDFGEGVRIPYFRTKVESPKSLGNCYLLASDNPATSVNDTVQSGDINVGHYTAAQFFSGAALPTSASTGGSDAGANQAIFKRYWRFVFEKQPPAV